MRDTFEAMFCSKLSADWRKEQTENKDPYRFWQGTSGMPLWRQFALKLGLDNARSVLRSLRIWRNADNLQWTSHTLKDAASRRLLVEVMGYRALGAKRVRLPLNNPDYWAAIERIESLRGVDAPPPPTVGIESWDLRPLGVNIRLRGRLMNIMNTFMLEQYRFKRDVEIGASPGDVVIDAGSCFGDTSVYFADRVGNDGRVYCYEFDTENLELFHTNISSNPTLEKRVRLVECALWREAGHSLNFIGEGPNTRLARPGAPGARQVGTDCIDALVARERIGRVDLIKMDIEGAELDALHGAEVTLRRDRPKLAISIYHRLEHFWQIPKYINSLGLGYEFYLDHFTIHAEETMLFCRVPRSTTEVSSKRRDAVPKQ